MAAQHVFSGAAHNVPHAHRAILRTGHCRLVAIKLQNPMNTTLRKFTGRKTETNIECRDGVVVAVQRKPTLQVLECPCKINKHWLAKRL
jgi:hypothetical protein